MSIDIAAIAARSSAGVVGITARGHRRGTGVVVADGVVLTTAHNARGGAVEVVMADGGRRSATLVAASEDDDLAVLRADTSGATPLAWGSADGLQTGMEVVAVGAPDGVARHTAGVVATTAARFRTASGSPVAGVIEHTAPLPAGSSGGPVLDAEGAVVAIDVNRTRGGLYQAVPADATTRATIEALTEGRTPTRRRLGVTLVPRSAAAHLYEAVGLDPRDGALVAEVDADGPAGRAGIARGDLLVSIDDRPITRPDDLLLGLRVAGATASLVVGRGSGADRTVTITFDEAG